MSFSLANIKEVLDEEESPSKLKKIKFRKQQRRNFG